MMQFHCIKNLLIQHTDRKSKTKRHFNLLEYICWKKNFEKQFRFIFKSLIDSLTCQEYVWNWREPIF